jgi:hypothetical protein
MFLRCGRRRVIRKYNRNNKVDEGEKVSWRTDRNNNDPAKDALGLTIGFGFAQSPHLFSRGGVF